MAFKKTKRKGFNFFRSYYDVYNELEKDSDKLAFIGALLDRQFLGVQPDELKGMARFAWISQVNSIDSQVKGYEDKTGVKLTPCQGGVNTPTEQEKEKGQVQEEVKEQDVVVKFSFRKSLCVYGANEILVDDWLKVRKAKKAANTETALNGFISQVEKSNQHIDEVLRTCIENSWKGFKYEWLEKEKSSEQKETGTVESIRQRLKEAGAL
jgi:hypothetical protein